MVENPLDIAIHWRRPIDFLQNDDTTSQKKNANTGEIHVFYDSIEPNDLVVGTRNNVLGTDYFLSAMTLLA